MAKNHDKGNNDALLNSSDFDDIDFDELYQNDSDPSTIALNDEDEDEDGLNKSRHYDYDSYIASGAFAVHNKLHINPNPTHEDLIRIMENYRNGNEDERKYAQEEMLGIMDAYLIDLVETKYSTFTNNIEELMSHGYLGILLGMKSYDPLKGKPTTWFTRYIDHEIQAYINTQIKHTTQHYNTAARKVNACIKRKKEHGIPFTLRDIYIETGVPLRTIEKCLRINDTTSSSLNSKNQTQDIPTEYGDPQVYVEQRSEKESIYNLIYGKKGKNKSEPLLSTEERACIVLRFGLDGTGIHSFAQIEHITGIPRYKVSKLQADALKKLKNALSAEKKSYLRGQKSNNSETDRYLYGELLTEHEMLQDQDDFKDYYDSGLLD